jgi:hypothetical protein
MAASNVRLQNLERSQVWSREREIALRISGRHRRVRRRDEIRDWNKRIQKEGQAIGQVS